MRYFWPEDELGIHRKRRPRWPFALALAACLIAAAGVYIFR
jgi:hypothetical protein